MTQSTGTRRTPEARAVLGAGLAVGVAWYVLQHHAPGRVDTALGLGVLLAVLVLLRRCAVPRPGSPDDLLLAVPAIMLLGAMLWRDSEMLFAVNLLAVAGLVALAAPGREGLPVLLSSISDLAYRGAATAACAAAGAVPVLRRLDLPMRALGGARWGIGLGVVAASPVLVIFSVLLSEADPVFGSMLRSAFTVELGPTLGRLVNLFLWTWLATGILWAVLRNPVQSGAAPLRGGRIDANVVLGGLGAIAVLFALFLLVQSRYLFGGRAVVLGTADLGFAQYARRGFFELVMVAACMLPLLLAADWAADVSAHDQRMRVRHLMRVLLLLLGGLLVSALMRMLVYTREMGLTEQRLFTSGFMLWLAFVLAWFGATVVKGRRDRFTGGALTAAMLTLLSLNLLSPAALITRVNIGRAGEGKVLDAAHLARIGGGAVPVALELMPRLSPADQCKLALALKKRWIDGNDERRRWTVEQGRALALRPAIQQVAQPCQGERLF